MEASLHFAVEASLVKLLGVEVEGLEDLGITEYVGGPIEATFARCLEKLRSQPTTFPDDDFPTPFVAVCNANMATALGSETGHGFDAPSGRNRVWGLDEEHLGFEFVVINHIKSLDEVKRKVHYVIPDAFYLFRVRQFDDNGFIASLVVLDGFQSRAMPFSRYN